MQLSNVLPTGIIFNRRHVINLSLIFLNKIIIKQKHHHSSNLTKQSRNLEKKTHNFTEREIHKERSIFELIRIGPCACAVRVSATNSALPLPSLTTSDPYWVERLRRSTGLHGGETGSL